MQEMYDWYMDNLFGEHYKQAVKHAEKDGRDRRKRIAKGGAGQAKEPFNADFSQAELLRRVSTGYDRSSYSGRSKWERIGSPFTASVVDWAIIINPWDFRPGWEKRRASAVTRQWERFEEYSN